MGEGNAILTTSMATSIPPYRASLGGWTIERYQNILGWPVLLLSLVCFILALFVDSGIVVMSQLFMVLGYGWSVAKKRMSTTPVIITGAILGVFLGTSASMGTWLAAHSLLWGLNVVTQTAVTGIASSALLTSIVLLIRQHTNN